MTSYSRHKRSFFWENIHIMQVYYDPKLNINHWKGPNNLCDIFLKPYNSDSVRNGPKSRRVAKIYFNNPPLCSMKERKSYWFGTAWGWMMTDFIFLGVNYPFKGVLSFLLIIIWKLLLHKTEFSWKGRMDERGVCSVSHGSGVNLCEVMSCLEEFLLSFFISVLWKHYLVFFTRSCQPHIQ